MNLGHVDERLRALLRRHGAKNSHGLTHGRAVVAAEHGAVGVRQVERMAVGRRDADRQALGFDETFADPDSLCL